MSTGFMSAVLIPKYTAERWLGDSNTISEKFLNKLYYMDQFLHILLYIQIALCFFCLYRIIKGPTIPDRMVGIDIFGILVVGICAIIAVITDRMFIIDIGIAWIILSFIGTLTLAKYLGGRKLNE